MQSRIERCSVARLFYAPTIGLLAKKFRLLQWRAYGKVSLNSIDYLHFRAITSVCCYVPTQKCYNQKAIDITRNIMKLSIIWRDDTVGF
jgi:hypothetical protein